MNKNSIDQKQLLNQKGQVFIEFILLLFILVALSRIFLGGFNGALTERWRTIVDVIARPTASPIEMR